jgi:hypothetical protein
MPHEELGRRLGAHRIVLTTETRVSTPEGEALAALSEKAELEQNTEGALRVNVENSEGDGYTLYRSGAEILLARRYASARPSDEAEVARLREAAFGALFGSLEPCAHALRFAPAGERPIEGRRALVFQLSPSPAPAPPRGLLPGQAWRATVALEAAEGEIVLDAETLAPLFADFSLRYQAEREGQKVVISAKARQELSGIGSKGIVFAAPALGEERPRFRIAQEREALLGKKTLKGKEAAPRPDEPKAASAPNAASKPAKAPTTQP